MRYVIKATNEITTLRHYYGTIDLMALTDTQRGEIAGWYKITSINDDFDVELFTLGKPTITYNDANYTAQVSYTLIPRTVTELLQRLANERWLKCNAGITFEGKKIDTSEQSRNAITGIVSAYQSGVLTGDVDFKAINGWITLNQATALTLAQALAAHVQECFAWERAQASLIIA